MKPWVQFPETLVVQETPCSLEFSKSTVCMCACTQIKKFTPKAQLFDLREFQDLAFSMEAEGEVF